MKTIRFFTVWIIALMGLMIANNPAWAKDKTRPIPGGYEAGYPKAVGMTTIEVKWKRATDNSTAQADLRYMVRWRRRSASWMDDWETSHPKPITNYPKDWTAYTITGLEPNTEYEVDAEVWDEAGNGKFYGVKIVKTEAADTEKPKAGCNGKITIGTVTKNSIALSWCAATDNVTPHSRMKYAYTYEEGFDAAGFPMDNNQYGTGITSGTITGLKPGTKYSVWVKATDEAGNSNIGSGTYNIQYHLVNVETKSDDETKPTPGGYVSGYPKAISPTQIEVKWTKGTDNVTSQANLRYQVWWRKLSESGWYSNHSDSNLPKDITGYIISGFSPNTEYLVDVKVFDEAGNGEWYGERTVKTQAAAAADNTNPTPGGWVSGYPKAVGTTSIEVKWTRGSDNVTATANLRYRVAWKKSSESDWHFSHPNNNLPKDITGYIISGLSPNTEYLVDVVVADEAGNGLWYGERTVKTQAAADNERPTPGSYEAGYPKATSPTTIAVKWTRGTDNVTTTANLRYRVAWKKKSGGSWLYSHSDPSTNWPKDWTAYTIENLEPNTEYVVDVVVVDEATNGEWYGERTVKTQAGGAADNTPPTPGGYGTITATTNTITVNWTKATDIETPQDKLEYRVGYQTVEEYNNSDQPYGTTFKTNITTEIITGLTPDTEYVIWVDVFDGKRSARYGEKRIKTQAAAAAVTGVTVSPASLNVEVGATGTLTASVAPDNASIKTVTWSSSNTAIATVDGSGTVKGIAPGTAVITVTTVDGNKTATATVTVKEASTPVVPVTGVTLNRTSVTINGNLKEVQLTASVAPSNATDKSLTWSSSNPAVASVDATGLVTIHKKGTATITVTASNGKTATCQVEVLSTVGNVAIDGLRMWAHGGALHLTLPNAATVHIYNVNGAIVKTLFLPSGDHVQPLADGMYLVRVGERVRKILVK